MIARNTELTHGTWESLHLLLEKGQRHWSEEQQGQRHSSEEQDQTSGLSNNGQSINNYPQMDKKGIRQKVERFFCLFCGFFKIH